MPNKAGGEGKKPRLGAGSIPELLGRLMCIYCGGVPWSPTKSHDSG